MLRFTPCKIPVVRTNNMAVGGSLGLEYECGRLWTPKQEVSCNCKFLSGEAVNFQLGLCLLPRTWKMGLSPLGWYSSRV